MCSSRSIIARASLSAHTPRRAQAGGRPWSRSVKASPATSAAWDPAWPKGLTLRPDNGSNYLSDDFRNEIRCFGIVSSPALVRQPEGNGVAERAIRTLKEQLLRVRDFATVEELRQALAAFAAEYNASWLRERHGYKTPNEIRAAKKALETEAATEFKMAA